MEECIPLQSLIVLFLYYLILLVALSRSSLHLEPFVFEYLSATIVVALALIWDQLSLVGALRR